MATDYPPSQYEPAPPIGEQWQKEINQIFGMNPFNEPLVRLVWGMDAEEFLFEKMRLRYPSGKLFTPIGWGVPVIKGGKTVDYNPIFPPSIDPPDAEATGGKQVVPLQKVTVLGTPRWFVEQWIGPNVASQGWEQQRFQWMYDPQRNTHRKVDVYGELPARGYYGRGFLCVAQHFPARDENMVPACCNFRKLQGYQCYGRYLAPNNRLLEYLRTLKWQMDQEPMKYAYDEMPPVDLLDQDARDQAYKEQKAEEKRDEMIRERAKDIISPHTKRLLSEGHGLDKFKYNFVGNIAHSKNVWKQTPGETEK